MEINPNHSVTQALHDQWHAVIAVMMIKLGITEMEITPADIERASAPASQKAVVADARGGRFVVRLMDIEAAMKLAKKEGGLPI